MLEVVHAPVFVGRPVRMESPLESLNCSLIMPGYGTISRSPRAVLFKQDFNSVAGICRTPRTVVIRIKKDDHPRLAN